MDYEVIAEPGKALVKAWTKGVLFEDKAREQVANLATLPFIHGHIAIMPDVHHGMGATVGSVIPTLNAIIPAAVGVDLGCGMCAIRTSLKASQLPDDLHPLRTAIEKAVPHGRTVNSKGFYEVSSDRGAWGNPPQDVQDQWYVLEQEFAQIIKKHPKIAKSNTLPHLGTLGTGNHFIEVCIEPATDDVWIMLHSGSRGVGNSIGSYFIELARKEMEKWFINLPDKDLAYLPQGSEHFGDYIKAVHWAQNFAFVNRELMLKHTIEAIKSTGLLPEFETDLEVINCHHNYVNKEKHFGKEVWVTRKGAVSARNGQLGIIPGSMGAKSFIVQGKGNYESLHSCSHGAGRSMSRTKAKQMFSLEDHKKATEGVECRKDSSVIDETPMAYKSIDDVMKAQEDLVEIVHEIKQVLCVKG